MYKITLAVDQGDFSSIHLAADAQAAIDWNDSSSTNTRTCTECFGALDLLTHLQKLSPSTEFEISSSPPTHGDAVIIGCLASIISPRNLSQLGKEGYLIHTEKAQGKTVTFLYGQTGPAVLYAISRYLEELGVRWFSPASHGSHIPLTKNFCLPDIHLYQTPSFKTRACYSELLDDSDEAFLDWLMHHRVNFVYLEEYHHTEILKKRGIQVCRGGHTILHRYFSPNTPYPYNHPYRPDCRKPADPYPLSPKAQRPLSDGAFTYFHAHPEWYGMIDGLRSQNLGTGKTEGFGDNFCTSNQDAVAELCRNLVESLINGELSDADYLNFWMLDNGRWCQCPKCRKIGNETARLCSVIYALNRSILNARKDGRLKREIILLFPAYHETLPLPDHGLPADFDYEHCIVTCFPIERCYVHHLDDTNCTETNCRLFQNLSAWAPSSDSTYQGDLFIGEYYNVSAFASISASFTEKIAYDIPLYYKMGARHMYYMHMTAKDWGTLIPTNYLFYSMLWDVEVDIDTLLQEFYSFYYRESAGIMEQFYSVLEKGSANLKYFKHYQYLYSQDTQSRLALFAGLNQVGKKAEDIFPLKHMQYDYISEDSNGGISAVDTLECYHKCRSLLEKARYYCHDETVAARLAEDTMRFEYTYLSLRYLFHMARLATFHAEKKTLLAHCEFSIAKQYAAQLKETVKPLQGLLHFEFYQNGLGATWAEEAFIKYSTFYGEDMQWNK